MIMIQYCVWGLVFLVTENGRVQGIEGENSFQSAFSEKYSIEARKIMRALSQNSRASISEISAMAGISRKTAVKKMAALGEEFGVRHTIEFNEEKIGLVNPHLVLLKFKTKPDPESIADILKKSHVPQLAVSMKGNYDMLIYANAASIREYVRWDKSTQIMLAEYGVYWQTSLVAHRQLGFFPLRNEALRRLNIDERERGMLSLLNSDARMSFKELASRMGMAQSTTIYNFEKLLGKGYVKRFTITMPPPKGLELMSFFSKYRSLSASFEHEAAQSRKVFMTDEQYPMVSKYLLCSQLVGSDDFFCLGSFDSHESAYKKDLAFYRKVHRKSNPRIFFGVVDKVVLGNLPIRSADVKEYDVIRWMPEI